MKNLAELKKEHIRIKKLADEKPENWYEYETKRHYTEYANGLAKAIKILEGNDSFPSFVWVREPHKNKSVAYKVELKITRNDGKQIDFSNYSNHSIWSGVTYSGGELAYISNAISDVITGFVKTKENEQVWNI